MTCVSPTTLLDVILPTTPTEVLYSFQHLKLECSLHTSPGDPVPVCTLTPQVWEAWESA